MNESESTGDAGADFPSQFERTRLLLGDAALRRLQQSRVTVVGLGAVGSYVVEALARTGVGSLRLIDFDRVEFTNVNRQLFALHSTVGRLKCEVAAERVRDINPLCEVKPVTLMVGEASLAEVLEPRPDLLVDAIDSLDAKVSLLAAAVAAGIPLLSSMGAARRSDPARIHVADIADTCNCPLARLIRKKLRRRGIAHGVTCVYSDEPVVDAPADAPAATARQTGDAPDDRDGRIRMPIGSLSTITGIFGLTLANAAIQRLCGPVT